MKLNTRWLLIGGLCCLGILSGGKLGWAHTAEEIIAQIQFVYNNTNSFKAAFVQETFIRSAKKTVRESGWVYYKRPGSMRWDYRRPKEKRVFLSPTRTWLYIPQDNVAYVREGHGGVLSDVIGRFLTGIGRITEEFIVTSEQGKGDYHLVLTPREPSGALKVFKITVDPQTFLVIGCRYTDDYGNEVSLRFERLELNVPLDDHFFQFHPPRGVEVNNL